MPRGSRQRDEGVAVDDGPIPESAHHGLGGPAAWSAPPGSPKMTST